MGATKSLTSAHKTSKVKVKRLEVAPLAPNSFLLEKKKKIHQLKEGRIKEQ